MHRRAVPRIARVEHALIGMEAPELRQQRRVHVEHSALVALGEGVRQDPHEPRQDHNFGTDACQFVGQCLLCRGPIGKAPIVHGNCRNPGVPRPRQAVGVGDVAEYRCQSNAQLTVPHLVDNGLQVTAAAGYQDGGGRPGAKTLTHGCICTWPDPATISPT